MRNICVVIAMAGVLALVTSGRAGELSLSANTRQGASPAGQHEHQPTPASAKAPDMMQKHREMADEMKAADATLDRLVEQMNAASGDAKVTATAAVVSELVRQHKSMHEQMMGGMMMK